MYKNIATVIKNTIEEINSRMDTAKEWMKYNLENQIGDSS